MMKYPGMLIALIWDQKIFVALVLFFTGLFAVLLFPFNDLSDAVTSAIAKQTNNQVYVQAGELNIHLLPTPSVSAKDLKVETALPAIEATWAKITPSMWSLITSLPTVIKAAMGNQEAARDLGSKIGVSISAEGVFGGEASLSLGAGKKAESGIARSRVTMSLEEINLKDVQRWADLSVNMQGRANFATDMQFSQDFQEQPEGDYELQLAKFVMPEGTVQVPMGEASFPLKLPTLTLQNVVLKGRMSAGKFIIEEGMFGQSQDPVYGRIRGQVDVRILPQGGAMVPQFGQYDLTVDLSTSPEIQKDPTLALAFAPIDKVKQAGQNGGAKYTFKANGVIGAFPNITRIDTY